MCQGVKKNRHFSITEHYFLMRSLGAHKLGGDLDIYPVLCLHPCSLAVLGFKLLKPAKEL